MRRAPGVPVVVSHKTRENQEQSFLKRMQNIKAKAEERILRVESGVARAQKLFPLGVKIVQIESIEACVRETQLNNNTVSLSPNCTQASVTMQDAFTFLGMVWDDDYFTLSTYHDKCCRSAQDHCCPSPFSSGLKRIKSVTTVNNDKDSKINNDKDSGFELSRGAIAGIVICAVIVAALLAVLARFTCAKKAQPLRA
mmetsp:Transcript_7048/g.15414  ORF Transcript_7048/g.15414 Transcript_7048/m.15414 type:complete len:197 (+) Transcript_7048:474-1064(+)